MTVQPLIGKVALVTGATRGLGKGIALQLGQAGALVYITGRTLKSTNGLGSLEDTANEIRERGGKCIPVQCDHENDQDIYKLFERIKNEQNERLDILINNAYKGVDTIFETGALKFWEQKPEVWDDINNVGLRNHYICTVYAARIMVPRKQGLIINVSSPGGLRYLFNVAYGIGKAAVDRMAADCGVELKRHNVTMISLYPGAVKTELVTHNQAKRSDSSKPTGSDKIFANAESIEFAGKIIVQMAQDKNIKSYTSKVVIGADYAQKYNIKDIDNRQIESFRQLSYILRNQLLPEKLAFLANFVPSFIKVPGFLLAIATSKF